MRTLLTAATLIAALLTCSPTALAFDLQGHRGARGHAPENTIAAFKRALDIGVTTIETDLGLTRDGVVVITHDRRLNPAVTRGPDGKWLAEAGPPIRALSLAELRGYDVGRIDPSHAYAKTFADQVASDGERIPALVELFDLVKMRGSPVKFNLETKLSPLAPDETADAAVFSRSVVDAVRGAGLADRVTLQSFDWRTLVEAKRIAPQIRTACLTQEGGTGDTVRADASGASPWHATLSLAKHDGSLPRLVKAAGCDVWSPFWRNVTPARIGEAHALGLAVLPWTVNDPAEMVQLIDAGVDGIITDYPDRLRRVLADKGKPLP